MIREWPDPENLYHEGVRDLIDMIDNRQKTIDTLDKRVAELELRNAYLEQGFVDILKNRLERLDCECNWQY